jgi:hypothetical protein
LDAEAVRARLPCHDLEIPALALLLAPLRQFLAAIGGIRPDLCEAWDEEREPAQELARADRVMDIDRGDIAGNGQAQGIDQQMPFPALNGLITNDKFCLTRHINLRLTWSRSPLPPLPQASRIYLPVESTQADAQWGGGHETAMARPAPGGPPAGRATTLGSRLPTPAGVDDVESIA